LAFLGHVLMENRNGLVIEARLTAANGTASANLARAAFTTPESGMKRNLFVNKHFSSAC
jgi:hypothetical protein